MKPARQPQRVRIHRHAPGMPWPQNHEQESRQSGPVDSEAGCCFWRVGVHNLLLNQEKPCRGPDAEPGSCNDDAGRRTEKKRHGKSSILEVNVGMNFITVNFIVSAHCQFLSHCRSRESD